jgi:hypothetical protein
MSRERLQLDAHMRFAAGWDTQLTHWLAAAERTSPKAVLSTYPPGCAAPL